MWKILRNKNNAEISYISFVLQTASKVEIRVLHVSHEYKRQL